MVQIKYFLQLGSIFCRNPQKKREKANREKLKVDRQFFKDVMCIFYFALFIIIESERKTAPVLKKNYHSFYPVSFINSPALQMKISIYSTYPF